MMSQSKNSLWKRVNQFLHIQIQERPELERSVTEYFWNNKGAASGFYSWNNKTPHTGFSPGATGSNIQTHNQTEVNKMLTSKKSMGVRMSAV